MKNAWKNLLKVFDFISTALVSTVIAIVCIKYREMVPFFLIIYTILLNIVVNKTIILYDVSDEKNAKAIWYIILGILLQIVFIVILILM